MAGLGRIGVSCFGPESQVCDPIALGPDPPPGGCTLRVRFFGERGGGQFHTSPLVPWLFL